MRIIRNVHARDLKATREQVDSLINSLGSPADLLWPHDRWPALFLDRPLQVGAQGGHSNVHYEVSHYERGRRVVFKFSNDPDFKGTHSFHIDEIKPGLVRLKHVLQARLKKPSTMLLWPFVIMPIHDALIEDAFDRAEASLASKPWKPRRLPPWVQLLRSMMPGTPGDTKDMDGKAKSLSVEEVQVPDDSLVSRAFSHVDYADAYRIRLPGGAQWDIDSVMRALVSVRLPWVENLMHLRNRIVSVVGLKTPAIQKRRTTAQPSFQPGTTAGIFKVFDRAQDEVLMGEDDRHLDFRVSLMLDSHAGADYATMSTVVHFKNGFGRAYFVPVRLFHRLIVPALLKNMFRDTPKEPLTTT